VTSFSSVRGSFFFRHLVAVCGLLLPLLVVAAERAVIAASGDELASEGSVTGPRLTFADARVRAPIPGQDKTVGYFTVTNDGGRPVVLTGARAAGVRAIEMHTTVRDGDMVRMRRLAEVTVAPGGTVRFEPGGLHLMLFGTSHLPETLDVELLTAGGDTLNVSFRRFALGG
jgi:periplasmic copper chaperone A